MSRASESRSGFRVMRKRPAGPRLRWALAGLAAAGCATTSGPVVTPPDAAAIHAAERARAAFETTRPLIEDADLAARVSEIGRRVVRATSLLGNRGPAGSLADGWRFAVLDETASEAFLFADRTVFVSRGALAALSGEAALESLFRNAAATFAAGGFRLPGAGGLVEQPLPLSLPIEETPAAATSSGPASRTAWLDLLDGLVFGEPAEYGVAEGPDLLLPMGDVRLSLPRGGSFLAGGRGVFHATRSREPIGLRVREIPPAASGGKAPADTGSHASGQALIRDLAARLRQRIEAGGAESSFVEAFRVRGFTGVRGRSQTEGASPALVALLRASGSLVEVRLDCARRRFEDCETFLLEVLESADRLWDRPVPGSLRITAAAASEPGPVRDALRRLAARGGGDGSLEALEFLNRGWLDEELSPGDRFLILSRDRRNRAVAPDGGDPGR